MQDRGEAFQCINWLRKLCCHPTLIFDDAHNKIGDPTIFPDDYDPKSNHVDISVREELDLAYF